MKGILIGDTIAAGQMLVDDATARWFENERRSRASKLSNFVPLFTSKAKFVLLFTNEVKGDFKHKQDDFFSWYSNTKRAKFLKHTQG